MTVDFSNLTEAELKSIAQNLARPEGPMGSQVADWMEEGNAPMVRAAQSIFAAKAGETAVEIGPGSGKLSIPMAQALGETGLLHLIEHADDMAKRSADTLSAPGLPELRIHTGDWADAKIESASCDGVIAVNVVYFISQLEAFLARCRGYLRPGGRVVLSVRPLETMRRLSVTRHGFVLRSLDTYIHALHASGFLSVSASYHPEPVENRDDSGRTPLDSVVLFAMKS